jgi:hypothetical protein
LGGESIELVLQNPEPQETWKKALEDLGKKYLLRLLLISMESFWSNGIGYDSKKGKKKF